MSPSSRFRAWRRQRKLRGAARRTNAPLREFIYLDDVSVYSLIASRIGPVATDFTDSQTASLQSDVAASAGVGVVGLAKADVSSRLQASQTQGSQVLRKAIVQTTFRELYELEKNALVMRPVENDDVRPQLRNAHELSSRGQQLRPWVVDAESLRRGELVEIEVELSAEPIFRMSTVISALVEMMQGNEELARAAASTGELDQVAAMSRVIERLLVGLIPVRGQAVDFDVVTVNERECLVHRRIAESLDDPITGHSCPLYVVGVAQEALFWKDIRRVLFSKSRYRVLCRVSRPGLHTNWAPVKLVEVLADVAPDLAAGLGAATESALAAIGEAGDGSSSESSDEAMMQAALLDYGKVLATHYGCVISEEEILAAGLPTPAQCASYDTIERRRDAFHGMTSFVAERCQLDVEPEIAALYRSSTWMEHRLVPPGGLQGSATPLMQSASRRSDERYLDVEFVAMYW